MGKKAATHMADILYQRLGTNWYAFTELEGEMYMSRVGLEAIRKENIQEEDFPDMQEFFNLQDKNLVKINCSSRD